MHHSAQCFGTTLSIELIESNKKDLENDREMRELIRRVSEILYYQV